QTEGEAPVRELGQGSRGHGDGGRTTVPHAQDARADADAHRLQGDIGKEHGHVVGPRFWQREGVVAELIRHAGHGDQHVAPSLQRHHGHPDPATIHGSSSPHGKPASNSILFPSYSTSLPRFPCSGSARKDPASSPAATRTPSTRRSN